MKAEERIINRLEELIGLGNYVLSTKTDTIVIGGDFTVSLPHASKWKMQSLNILQHAFGSEGLHYKEFVEVVNHLTYSPVEIGNSILEAALGDLQGGHLAGMKELVEAEIFTDFMDQAEELFSKGYHQAAAVVAGCVLEDALRKMCEQHPDIELPDKPKLNSMNDDLRKHNVYNLLTHKRITANADLRNKAAHGEWEEFDKDDVKEMMSSINTFMQKHFG
ncbi:MAG: DUF4145 domain-containing protein [Gimesia sp.]|nr:DUF4145 domain-containing protein [Gimesia sp.]